MDQPGKVANSAHGQPNRKNEYFPVPVRAREVGLARRVRPSRPTSACSFSTPRLNLVLTHGIPPDFRDGVHYIAIRHRAGPEFIGSRNCVPMVFTAESPPTRASKPQGSFSNECCLFRPHRPINVRLSFQTCLGSAHLRENYDVLHRRRS